MGAIKRIVKRIKSIKRGKQGFKEVYTDLGDFHSFLNKYFEESMKYNSFMSVMMTLEKNKMICIEEGKIILTKKGLDALKMWDAL